MEPLALSAPKALYHVLPMGAAPGQDPTPRGGGVPPPLMEPDGMSHRGPPPPCTDPKMVVQNIGFCGARGAGDFVLGIRQGEIFFVRPDVFVLKILRILWRIQKWMKNTKKDFGPGAPTGTQRYRSDSLQAQGLCSMNNCTHTHTHTLSLSLLTLFPPNLPLRRPHSPTPVAWLQQAADVSMVVYTACHCRLFSLHSGGQVR